MAIIDYVGAEGCCITVESAEDLHEAIDHLHTLVMDNISEDSPLLGILSEAMDAIERVDSEAVEQPLTQVKTPPPATPGGEICAHFKKGYTCCFDPDTPCKDRPCNVPPRKLLLT